MVFNVRHLRDDGVPEAGIEPMDTWDWQLVLADGEVVCRSGKLFATEKEARSHVAQAKKTMKGAMRSKVVTVDDST